MQVRLFRLCFVSSFQRLGFCRSGCVCWVDCAVRVVQLLAGLILWVGGWVSHPIIMPTCKQEPAIFQAKLIFQVVAEFGKNCVL